ncbi:hypothetical protein FRC12_010793 [Ceratobasidium sp. 428]|nr:hypothetical protein FRC12_010793 [Ceratobasidium sp. 428]
MNIKTEHRSSGPKMAQFHLKREFDEVINKCQEFKKTGDSDGLAEWETNRRKLVEARSKHGNELHKYLDSVQKSRDDELGSIKQQRKDVITERLKAPGWTDEDLRFSYGDRKQWHALVGASKPLTDRIWNNIRSKLIALLEDNREKQSAVTKRWELLARLRCVDEHVQATRHIEHPLEPIVAALKMELPPSPELDEFNIHAYGGPIELREYKLKNYIPSTRLALTWDCLNSLSEREITTEEMKSELEVRKDQIEQTVLEWRADTERRLTEEIWGAAGLADGDTALVVKGSTELTKGISRDLRLLLRADTVFKYSLRQESDGENSPLYYPVLITQLYDRFYEYDWDFEDASAHVDYNLDLREYERNVEVEKILKLLLADLGMPDVTRLELQVVQSRFLCGRCIDKIPKTWDQMVSRVEVTEPVTVQN